MVFPNADRNKFTYILYTIMKRYLICCSENHPVVLNIYNESFILQSQYSITNCNAIFYFRNMDIDQEELNNSYTYEEIHHTLIKLFKENKKMIFTINFMGYDLNQENNTTSKILNNIINLLKDDITYYNNLRYSYYEINRNDPYIFGIIKDTVFQTLESENSDLLEENDILISIFDPIIELNMKNYFLQMQDGYILEKIKKNPDMNILNMVGYFASRTLLLIMSPVILYCPANVLEIVYDRENNSFKCIYMEDDEILKTEYLYYNELLLEIYNFMDTNMSFSLKTSKNSSYELSIDPFISDGNNVKYFILQYNNIITDALKNKKHSIYYLLHKYNLNFNYICKINDKILNDKGNLMEKKNLKTEITDCINEFNYQDIDDLSLYKKLEMRPDIGSIIATFCLINSKYNIKTVTDTISFWKNSITEYSNYKSDPYKIISSYIDKDINYVYSAKNITTDLSKKHADCFGGSLFLFSIFKYIGINCCVLLNPTHSYFCFNYNNSYQLIETTSKYYEKSLLHTFYPETYLVISSSKLLSIYIYIYIEGVNNCYNFFKNITGIDVNNLNINMIKNIKSLPFLETIGDCTSFADLILIFLYKYNLSNVNLIHQKYFESDFQNRNNKNVTLQDKKNRIIEILQLCL
jgi:hypothetical protein